MMESSAELLEMKTPDAFFKRLDSTIIRVGLAFFSEKAEGFDDGTTAIKQKRLQLLKERRNMRGSAMDITAGESESVCAELKEVTKQCNKLTKQTKVARRDALIEELWDHWRHRRMSECQVLLREINATFFKHGGNRTYVTLRAALPISHEWMQVLAGHRGQWRNGSQ